MIYLWGSLVNVTFGYVGGHYVPMLKALHSWLKQAKAESQLEAEGYQVLGQLQSIELAPRGSDILDFIINTLFIVLLAAVNYAIVYKFRRLGRKRLIPSILLFLTVFILSLGAV
ncbi:hypothetical protein M3231_14430 [Neobacillus mesonae]|nr:hypothetical protein [Neobacillus mesonae]